jgi:hypothetical protein
MSELQAPTHSGHLAATNMNIFMSKAAGVRCMLSIFEFEIDIKIEIKTKKGNSMMSIFNTISIFEYRH